MKRITLFFVAILLALQFTCGHKSMIKRADCPTVTSHENGQKVSEAKSELSDAKDSFWAVSARIDALLTKKETRKAPAAMRASDPINY